MATPDWQLPPGVDRGLWDYLRSEEMVRGYDEQIAAAPLSRADVAFCERHFPTPGRLIDLGCGTGRLCVHFAQRGFDCVGVDLSEEMLAKAKGNATEAGVSCEWIDANLVGLAGVPDASFDYAACLFSTLGMVRGGDNRAAALKSAHRVLKPGGTLVLHAHYRYFRGLRWKTVLAQRWRTLRGSPAAGDVTMPQAYGGAPLTLHHFTRGELVGLLEGAGFRVRELVGVSEAGVTGVSPRTAYGFLAAATRGG
jgi:SAM-dependent methyltransferase